jgi:hypothetical protein
MDEKHFLLDSKGHFRQHLKYLKTVKTKADLPIAAFPFDCVGVDSESEPYVRGFNSWVSLIELKGKKNDI